MRSSSPVRSAGTAALVAAVVAFLIYVNSLGNAFAYDDVHILPENPLVQSLDSLPRALTTPYWPNDFGRELGLWRPATTLTFSLGWTAFGGSPLPFHLFDALAHAAATALVVLVVAQLLTVPAALLSGLVFAVHPVHVEAVANIVGIAEVQAAVLFLAACLLHLKGGERYGWGRVAAIAGLYAGAFLTKESAVTLPGVIFLLDAARERLGVRDLSDYVRRRIGLYGTLVVVAALVLAGRWAVLGSVAHPMGPLGADQLTEIPRLWTVGGIWTHYVRLMLFPARLLSDYSPNVIPILHGWTAASALGVSLVLGALALAWAAWRRAPLAAGSMSARAIGFGVMWFVITISPIANVVFVSGVLLAERTLYLPSVGVAVAIGWALARVRARDMRAGWALAAIVLSLMGFRTWRRNPTWKDNGVVFGTMIAQAPESGRSQWVQGDISFDQGDLRNALKAWRLAVVTTDSHYILLASIGKKLMGVPQHDRVSEFLLLQAYNDKPEFSAAPSYLATMYARQRRWPETERFGRISAGIHPDDGVLSHLVAGAIAAQGKYAEAIPWREAAIRNGEGEHWQQWANLAALQLAVGDSTAARAAVDSARVRGADPRALEAMARALGSGR